MGICTQAVKYSVENGIVQANVINISQILDFQGHRKQAECLHSIGKADAWSISAGSH